VNPDLSKASSESLGLSCREKHWGRWHKSLRNSALDCSLTLVKWWGLSMNQPSSYGIALITRWYSWRSWFQAQPVTAHKGWESHLMPYYRWAERWWGLIALLMCLNRKNTVLF